MKSNKLPRSLLKTLLIVVMILDLSSISVQAAPINETANVHQSTETAIYDQPISRKQLAPLVLFTLL